MYKLQKTCHAFIMTNQIIPLDNLELQIEMLYCQYGWDIPKIAAILQVNESVVRVAVEAKKLIKRDVEEPTDAVTLITKQQEASFGTVSLKADEVTKQQQLAPMMAAIEITLLQKAMDMALKVRDPDTLTQVVNAYKKLTQNAVINTVVQEETKNNAAPSVMVNVVNRFE